MRAWIILSFAATACLLAAGCGNGNGYGNGDGVSPPIAEEDLMKAGLEYRWEYDHLLLGGETIEKVWALDENLYLLTSENRLAAIRNNDGILLWTIDLGMQQREVFPPVHVDSMNLTPLPLTLEQGYYRENVPEADEFDAMAINTISRMWVVNRSTGRVYRALEFDDLNIGFAANAGGTASARRFYFAGTRGFIQAVGLPAAVRDWRVSVDALVSVPLVFHSGYLYAGDSKGTVHCIAVDQQEIKTVWTSRVDGPVVAAFHVDDRGCFVPSKYGRLYAYDYGTGRLLQGYPVVLKGDLPTPVQVSELSVFQYATQSGLSGVNLVTGEIRWQMPEGRFVLGVNRGEVYVLDRDGNLRVVNELTGQAAVTVPMTGYNLFAHTARHDRVFAASRTGRVVCIQKVGTGLLRPGL